MATVKITAGAESADSSSRCRSSVNVAAASDMRTFPFRSSHPSTSRRPLLLRDQRIERLVRIGTGLIDGLLLQDQVLHGLADEFARFGIGDDRIADLGGSLGCEHVERGLPFLAYRLGIDPLAVFGIVGDRRPRRRDSLQRHALLDLRTGCPLYEVPGRSR